MTFAELRKTSFAFGRNCEPPAELVGGFVGGSKHAKREVVRAEDLFRAYHEYELPDGFLDREAFRTVFQFPHAEYGRYFVEHGGSLKGYAGPAACCRITWDIDREGNLDGALADLRKLVRVVRDRYGGLAERGLSVAFSGGKGFHAELLAPAGFTPLPLLPAVVKAVALAVARQAGVGIDASIYHHQALIRLPNPQHPSGLYKRLFDPDDLDRLTVPAILDMARHPAGFSVPIHYDGCEQLADDLEDAERNGLAGRATVGHRTPPPGSPVVPKFVRDFIGFGDVHEPGRAVTLFRCAAALAEAGTPSAVVYGLLEEVALKSGLEPVEVAKHIGDGIAQGRPEGGGRVTPRYRSALAVARDKATYDLDATPVRWTPPPPFDALDVRPGRVILIGAPPAPGKTTLVLQLVTSILETHPEIRAVIGNVETAPAVLLDKLLAQFAAVDMAAVMDRTLTTEERRRIDDALRDQAGVLDRVNFLEEPFTVEAVFETMRATKSRLAVFDYVQRFSSGDKDDRAKLDEVMSKVRRLASCGAAVFVVSSVTRQKDRTGGSSYAGLSLAAFRGSAELEFGADDAYLLHADPPTGSARLEHVKHRFSSPRDVHLRFRGEFQRFDAGDELDGFGAAGKGGT